MLSSSITSHDYPCSPSFPTLLSAWLDIVPLPPPSVSFLGGLSSWIYFHTGVVFYFLSMFGVQDMEQWAAPKWGIARTRLDISWESDTSAGA